MENVLPGLNYDAKLAEQDWKTGRDQTEAAVISRFLLAMGSPPNALPQYGIADLLDPSQVASTDVTRPLLVTVSTLNSLQINVNPGTAVTQSGAILSISQNPQFSLARVQAGDINVVFGENALTVGGTQPVNDYNEALNTLEIQDSSLLLQSVLMADWNNTSLFPAARKQNIVVIAIVSAIATADSSIELQIDLSKSIYSFNRPWFSFMDIQHRAMVGSGAVTVKNPHGETYNDLTLPGDVPLFSGLGDTGLVVSRDRAINKMTGSNACSESLTVNRVLTDSAGIVTAKSRYGGVGARYVQLIAFPCRLGSVYETATPANSISAEFIEGTNLLVFGPQEVLTNPLTVEYSQAVALCPPVNVQSNLMTFTQPFTAEVLTAGGLTFDTIPNPNIDLDGSGPYPRRYRIYMLSDSSLTKFPQILNPSERLDDLGSSLVTPATQPIAPGRISIGMTKATNVSGMAVAIQISGQDVTGTNIQEILTIANASGYVDETVPSTNYDSANQIYITSQVFATVQTIQILSRASDGPLTEIQMWVEAEAGTAPSINDITAAALVGWNGQGIADIKDARVISRGFFKPDYFQISALGDTALNAIRMAANCATPQLVLAAPPQYLMSEDFEDLHYFDTVSDFFDFVQPTGTITIGNNSLIEQNDTLTIAPGKVLTAVVATADSTVGQFQIGADASTTLSNIVTAVNDPTFNSGSTGILTSSATATITYIGQNGQLGNSITITRALADGNSIQVTGFSRGFDRYGECYLDRNVTGLRSLNIPLNTDLYAYGYQFRGRYRSRAIALPSGVATSNKFCVVVHGHDPYYGSSIRIRGSDQSNPGQWLGWQIMSDATPGTGQVYIATIAAQCHKVQVEVYGRMRGLSLFNVA